MLDQIEVLDEIKSLLMPPRSWIKKILQQDPEIEVEDGAFSAKKKLSEATL
jgi:hypothetical protein